MFPQITNGLFPPFFFGSFWVVSFVVSSSLLISYFVLSNVLFILFSVFFISDIVYFLFLKLWFRPLFIFLLVLLSFLNIEYRCNCLMLLSANSNICVNSVFQLINYFYSLYVIFFLLHLSRKFQTLWILPCCVADLFFLSLLLPPLLPFSPPSSI